MITKENYISYILENIPEFQNSWEYHNDYWDGDEAGICNDMGSFVDATAEYIRQQHIEILKRIFDVAEYLLMNGSKDIETAVATCFLESLINRASAGDIDSLGFVKFLGENSRLHCKKCDEFMGAKTIGL